MTKSGGKERKGLSWLGLAWVCLSWLKLKVKRCSRAAPNPTPRRKLSLFLFSILFFPFFSFFFPFFSFFPSFRPSFSFFLFSPWGWVRRCLAASLSLLSVSCFRLLCFQRRFCFRFLCFQLSLSLWPLFSASASGSSIFSPLFILSSISSVQGSVLTLAAMAFSCRHWVRVMVRLSMW